MKIAIITDTHDRRTVIDNAVAAFEQRGVSYILHAGDITSPATARALAQTSGATLIAVFGNCDCDRSSLETAITGCGGQVHDSVFDGTVERTRVLMSHDPITLRSTPWAGKFDLVVYGHTHIHDIHKDGETLVVNASQAMAVILELDDMSYEVISL